MSWPHEIETFQQREGRWVLTDLEGKGRRICDYPTRILVGGGLGVRMWPLCSLAADSHLDAALRLGFCQPLSGAMSASASFGPQVPRL